MNGSAHSERGIVLLNALVIIAIVAAIGATLIRRDLEYRERFKLMMHADQARHFALAAEGLALELLAFDAAETETDHLGEAWAESDRQFDIEGAVLKARLIDLQGRFNINGLVTRGEIAEGETGPVPPALHVENFALLDALVEVADGPAGLSARMAEWIADGLTGLPGATGDRPYLTGPAPFLRPRQTLLTARHIRQVDGMTATTFDALIPALSALPGPTAINVNTAPRPVLAAMLPGMAPVALDRLISTRTSAPFPSVTDFLDTIARSAPPRAQARAAEIGLDVRTTWFLLEIEVLHGPARVRMYSVLRRPYDDGEPSVYLRSDAPL